MFWIRTRLAGRDSPPAPWKMNYWIWTRTTRKGVLPGKCRWWCSLLSPSVIIGTNSTKEVLLERGAAVDQKFKESFRMAILGKATSSWIQLLTITSRTQAPTRLVATRTKPPILPRSKWTNAKNRKRRKKGSPVSLQVQPKTRCTGSMAWRPKPTKAEVVFTTSSSSCSRCIFRTCKIWLIHRSIPSNIRQDQLDSAPASNYITLRDMAQTTEVAICQTPWTSRSWPILATFWTPFRIRDSQFRQRSSTQAMAIRANKTQTETKTIIWTSSLARNSKTMVIQLPKMRNRWPRKVSLERECTRFLLLV